MNFKIPEFYMIHLRKHLSLAELLMLKLLIIVIQAQRYVQLGKLASDLPLPITYESRRKKIQRFLMLPQQTVQKIWGTLITDLLNLYFHPTESLHIAIDRTKWSQFNFLIISIIWDKRAIPLYFELLPKKGNSNFQQQKAAFTQILPIIKNYRIVILGDREFCSVILGNWLDEQKVNFCLRLKKSEYILREGEMWVELKKLGIRPGMSLFLSGTKVTKFKGFKANVACKWKGKYRGVTVKEGWFILTNLKTLKAAISAYKQRFDIEEMFRDYKSGGYNLEDAQVSEPRLLTLMLLVSIAYTATIIEGKLVKKVGVQKYVARPKQPKRIYRSHSTFQVGVRAENWVSFMDICQEEVREYISLHPNKRSNYQRGKRAAKLIRTVL